MSREKTLRDIALAAKVSTSTVCRVIKGVGSPDVRARVRGAARKLGVDLNEKVKSKVVAFILSNRGVLHPFHSRVLTGAEAYCAEHGYDLLLILSFRYPSNISWKELSLPQALRHGNLVRAAILAGTNSPNFLTLLGRKGIPFAILGNNVVGEWEPKDYDVVYYDDLHGAYEMTRQLLSLGHKDIWFVGNREFPWFARCGDGYRRAMEEAGLLPRFRDILSNDGQDVGYLATKSILSHEEPISAILAGSAEAGVGVYKALDEFGRKIPDDVSVAGVGELEATMLRPQLTAFRPFPEQLGEHLAEMVIERINHPGLPTRRIAIPTEIVNRESCCAARLPSAAQS